MVCQFIPANQLAEGLTNYDIGQREPCPTEAGAFQRKYVESKQLRAKKRITRQLEVRYQHENHVLTKKLTGVRVI